MTTRALTLPTPLLPTWARPEVFPFQSRFADIDGARLHYCDEGDGQPLLLLHGSPLWSFMYRDVITALRDRYRVIAVDLPGLGLSTAPLVRGAAFSRNAELLEAFVRDLALGEFSLAVHATAGPSGLLMATRMPARIRSLIISNTFAWDLMTIPAMAKFVRVVSGRVFGFLNVYLNLLPRLTSRIAPHNGCVAAPERAAIVGPYRHRTARRHLQNLLFGLRAEREMFVELERRMSALHNVPTLLAFGAHDHGLQAGAADRFGAMFRRHVRVVFARSAHFPLLDEPARVVAAYCDFIDEVHTPAQREMTTRSERFAVT